MPRVRLQEAERYSEEIQELDKRVREYTSSTISWTFRVAAEALLRHR